MQVQNLNAGIKDTKPVALDCYKPFFSRQLITAERKLCVCNSLSTFDKQVYAAILGHKQVPNNSDASWLFPNFRL